MRQQQAKSLTEWINCFICFTLSCCMLMMLISAAVAAAFVSDSQQQQLNFNTQQQQQRNFNGLKSTEQKLIEKLLKNYNKKFRPPGTIEVKFAVNLNQIVNLMEKDQIMVINAFVDHEWQDQRLTWDPLEHDNLTMIRISGDQLWTPDTFIYTTADQSGFLLPQPGAYFVVRSEGIIFWPNPLTQMRLRCRMSIVWFPFDDQLCIIVFGSWSYTSSYLNYTLISPNPELTNLTEHNEFVILSYKPVRTETKFDNWIENDVFSEIRYKILIRRKPLFVIQNCVFPAIMLCILTLVSFFIPFAQEMQIGISIMLAFSVFKLRLSDDVPVQSDSIPLINIYFTLCMSFSLTAMIWFSIMNKLKEFKHAPRFIRFIVINYLFILMCVDVKKKLAKAHEEAVEKKKKMAAAAAAANYSSSPGKLHHLLEMMTNSINSSKKKSVDHISKASNDTVNNHNHNHSRSQNHHYHHHHHHQQQQQQQHKLQLQAADQPINIYQSQTSLMPCNSSSALATVTTTLLKTKTTPKSSKHDHSLSSVPTTISTAASNLHHQSASFSCHQQQLQRKQSIAVDGSVDNENNDENSNNDDDEEFYDNNQNANSQLNSRKIQQQQNVGGEKKSKQQFNIQFGDEQTQPTTTTTNANFLISNNNNYSNDEYYSPYPIWIDKGGGGGSDEIEKHRYIAGGGEKMRLYSNASSNDNDLVQGTRILINHERAGGGISVGCKVNNKPQVANNNSNSTSIPIKSERQLVLQHNQLKERTNNTPPTSTQLKTSASTQHIDGVLSLETSVALPLVLQQQYQSPAANNNLNSSKLTQLANEIDILKEMLNNVNNDLVETNQLRMVKSNQNNQTNHQNHHQSTPVVIREEKASMCGGGSGGSGGDHVSEDIQVLIRDADVLTTLNQFVFIIFLLFCLSLNFFGLYFAPYHIKKPLSIDAEN